jgi:soluble lytic murein transglycosylase-like protein
MNAISHLQDAGRAALSVTRTLLAFVGVLAVAGFMLQPLQRGLDENGLLAGEPFGGSALVAAGPIQQAQPETAHEREQRLLTEFIAKRYRVSEQAVGNYVAHAYQAGAQHSVDPLLILAVMAVESRYNPVAESNMGAKGLMQVIPKWHLEKLEDHGGEQAVLEPSVNIEVGARILREYHRRVGDLERSLQMYNGALDHPHSQYASKVFAEKARLREVLRPAKPRRQSAQSA